MTPATRSYLDNLRNRLSTELTASILLHYFGTSVTVRKSACLALLAHNREQRFAERRLSLYGTRFCCPA